MRVLALIEANVLTGPAKNLIAFASRVRGWQERPVEITLATYERRNPEENRFLQAARLAEVPYEVIFESGAFDLSVIGKLRRLIRRVRPDIIQTHAVKSHFLMLLTGAWRSTPWIAFHHGYTATTWKTTAYNRFDRVSLRWPRRIVTVCQPFADEIYSQGIPAGQVSIIHNAIQPFTPPPEELICETRSRFQLPEGMPVILAVGRLSQEKGYGDLVDAANRIRSSNPALPFRLAIVGEGPERAAMERQIAAAGLSESVVLCGHQMDVRPFYAIASVVALPSHSEGSPNVLLEAQAAGVPVVATAVGGVPEIATHGKTALLVARGDKTGMADALASILQNRELAGRLAEAGRRHVLERFTPEVHMRLMVSVYKEVLAG